MHRGADISLLGTMRSQSPSVLQPPLPRASRWPPPQAPALPRHSWAPTSRPELPLARGSAWPRDVTGQLTSPHKDPAHQPPRPPYPARRPTPKALETCFQLVAGSRQAPSCHTREHGSLAEPLACLPPLPVAPRQHGALFTQELDGSQTPLKWAPHGLC